MKRIVALCSGGGSNLQAILDACARGDIDGSVVKVITSASQAYALTRAELNGIEHIALPKRRFSDEAACMRARHEAILSGKPDLIVLAGYLGILSPETVHMYQGRIMNIHPALIPSFCGKGMYGHHVHESVLNYGAKLSGATVHFVDEGTDTGPIILQKSVPVLDDDNADSLAARVLIVEHELLPQAVALFCQDRLQLEGRHVRILPQGGSECCD